MSKDNAIQRILDKKKERLENAKKALVKKTEIVEKKKVVKKKQENDTP